jgi:hypothetical protein
MKLNDDVCRFTPTSIVRSINESVNVGGGNVPTSGLLKVRGIFQRYDVANANDRVYPKALFDKVLKDPHVLESLKTRSMLGLLEHPEDGMTRLDRVPSHVITEIKDNGDGTIVGEALILDTSTGRDLAGIFSGGCSVGISSRGDGETDMVEGHQRVNPDTYKLITWDFVYDNSVPGARPLPVQESVNSVVKENTTVTLSEKDYKKDPEYQKLLSDIQQSKDNNKKKEYRKKLCGYCDLHGINCDNDPELKALVSESVSRSNIESVKQPMSKLNEMRQLEVALNQLLVVKPKNLSFNAKAALAEGLADNKTKVYNVMSEDPGMKGYGDKLLKVIKEAEDELEDIPSESPEVPTKDSSKPGMPEQCDVPEECFCTVFSAIASQLFPGIDADKLNKYCKNTAYPAFCKGNLGSVKEDLENLVGNSEVGGEDSEIEGTSQSTNMDSEKELESACDIISSLTKKLKESTNASKIQEYRSLLAEAQEELSKSPSSQSGFNNKSQYISLLREARDEIVNLRSQLSEEKSYSSAAILLLKKHGITDASALRKVEECDKTPTNKDKEENKEDGKEGDKEKGKEGKNESTKNNITESTEEPDIVRVIRRLRKGAFNQM